MRALVGGCGSAGYDGASDSRRFVPDEDQPDDPDALRAFRWDDESNEPTPGGDCRASRSPRDPEVLGDATCDIHYYAELEFGHQGNVFGRERDNTESLIFNEYSGHWSDHLRAARRSTAPIRASAREAWIEYEAAPALAFPDGPSIKTAATRS